MIDDAMWVPPTLADYDWPERLAANLAAAALEELRVRAAERRVRERYGKVLVVARRLVPVGGRR